MEAIDIYPNENIIKAALINYYARINRKPFVVCSELTVSEEYKIADLVFCKDHLSYAYEIKAWNDDMRRLPTQIGVYCKLFDYIYVVTTENHLNQLQSIPDFVGIVIYSGKNGKTDPLKTDEGDPWKTVQTDPLKTEEIDHLKTLQIAPPS